MSDLLLEDIKSIGELLAHALELEVQSAERYHELADCMHVHNNPQVAALFRRLATYGDRHAEDVKRRAAGYELPAIPPWDFKWCCPEAPECSPVEATHYLMTVREALELALENEIRGRDFYAQIAAASSNPDVQHLAAEFALEEGAHVDMLRQWLATGSYDAPQVPEDLDPPHTPE